MIVPKGPLRGTISKIMEKILNVNKPAGMTSCAVVEYIKKKNFPEEKVGHAGTLDPMSTGVLLICVGSATKEVSRLMEYEKEYEGEMTLGVSTDSYDADGKVVQRVTNVSVRNEDVRRVLKKFRGEIEQVPPMFSALRHKGKRLYEYARQGKVVSRKARRIKVHKFEILAFHPGEYPKVDFRVVCSKGTYIRGLVDEAGKILGCGAYLSKLTRTRIGNFHLRDSLNLNELALWKL